MQPVGPCWPYFLTAFPPASIAPPVSGPAVLIQSNGLITPSRPLPSPHACRSPSFSHPHGPAASGSSSDPWILPTNAWRTHAAGRDWSPVCRSGKHPPPGAAPTHKNPREHDVTGRSRFPDPRTPSHPETSIATAISHPPDDLSSRMRQAVPPRAGQSHDLLRKGSSPPSYVR